MSGVLSWLSELVFGVDPDEVERAALKRQLEEERRNGSQEIDDRTVAWLNVNVYQPTLFNVFIAVVDRDRWEQSIGTYADSDNQTVRLFNMTTAAEYLKTHYFTPAFLDKERAKLKERLTTLRPHLAAIEPMTLEVDSVLIVYVYLYNQEKDTRQLDNPNWKADVRFKKGLGTILYRAIVKQRDLHATFSASVNIETGKVRFPSTDGLVSLKLQECAIQYGIRPRPTDWRFDVGEKE